MQKSVSFLSSLCFFQVFYRTNHFYSSFSKRHDFIFEKTEFAASVVDRFTEKIHENYLIDVDVFKKLLQNVDEVDAFILIYIELSFSNVHHLF